MSSGEFTLSGKMGGRYIKRYFDLAAVIISSPIWVPLFAAVAFLVRWKLGSPIFFRQKRPGCGEQIFEMIKFRSMREAVDSNGRALADAERLTSFGRRLRATSLDELPELINVLRGEMSLVGPRPLLVEYLMRYSNEQRRRHLVSPGLTGWAQVNGRNALSCEEKFALDVWYVENRSFRLDLLILFLTVWQVLSRKGVSAHGEATMPEFKPPTVDSREI